MEILPVHVRLYKRAHWLVRLRWFAIAGVVLAAFVASYFLKLEIRSCCIYLTASVLFVTNISYFVLLRLVKKQDSSKIKRNSKRIINLQISIDFILLTVLLHYSGGIENPFIIFYIFHMIIGSTVLAPRDSYLQTTFALFLFIGLTYLEWAGFLEHYSLNKFISELISSDTWYLLAAIIVFIIASYLVVYMTSNIAVLLRRQEKAYRIANFQLQEQDKIKNEYVQRVTHDIKGHLAVIQSSLSILEKGTVAPVDEKNAKFVEAAYRRTLQLSDFVKDLLHLTNMRLNSKFEAEVFNLAELLEKAFDFVIPNAQNKNIALNQDFDNTLGVISGDKFSIEEVFTNLLLNAIKYTPEGGIVGLHAHLEKDYAVVEVYDNGLGIPEDDIPRIFEEFYRASNVKKTNTEGTGLGLSLVKQIVDRHQGTISVKSVVNEGTTFTVRIPVKPLGPLG